MFIRSFLPSTWSKIDPMNTPNNPFFPMSSLVPRSFHCCRTALLTFSTIQRPAVDPSRFSRPPFLAPDRNPSSFTRAIQVCQIPNDRDLTLAIFFRDGNFRWPLVCIQSADPLPAPTLLTNLFFCPDFPPFLPLLSPFSPVGCIKLIFSGYLTKVDKSCPLHALCCHFSLPLRQTYKN